MRYLSILIALAVVTSASAQFTSAGPDPRDRPSPRREQVDTREIIVEVEYVAVWRDGRVGERHAELVEEIEGETDETRKERLEAKLERLEKRMPKLVCGRQSPGPLCDARDRCSKQGAYRGNCGSQHDVPVELHVRPPRSRTLDDLEVGDFVEVVCAVTVTTADNRLAEEYRERYGGTMYKGTARSVYGDRRVTGYSGGNEIRTAAGWSGVPAHNNVGDSIDAYADIKRIEVIDRPEGWPDRPDDYAAPWIEPDDEEAETDAADDEEPDE